MDFPTFKGIFENLVHYSTDLNGVQKVHYLKQTLLNSVTYELVRDFLLTEVAYAEAYSLIISRYDSKGAIVRSLFRTLLELEPINSGTKIQSLIDKIESIMHGLKAVGEKIDDSLSRFIKYLVATRLDRKTIHDWENSFTSTKSFPLYNDLQNFYNLDYFQSKTSHKIILRKK